MDFFTLRCYILSAHCFVVISWVPAADASKLAISASRGTKSVTVPGRRVDIAMCGMRNVSIRAHSLRDHLFRETKLAAHLTVKWYHLPFLVSA